MIRKYLMVLAVIFLSVISFGTAKAKDEPQEVEKYVANFDYTPTSQAAPGSAGVTFAIGNVGYMPSDLPSDASSDLPSGRTWIQELILIKKVNNGKLLWFFFPQFDSLHKAIKDDLSKLLTAKGFSVRGPFDSYDLMPYSDKKTIDLYLIPTLELSFILKDDKWSEGYYRTGNVEINSKITLELREIVTRELMWVKSIPLTKLEFPCRIRTPYHPDGRFNLIMNDAAKGIEQQYPNLMATISKLIDPEEMQIIKKQCQEIRSKKGY